MLQPSHAAKRGYCSMGQTEKQRHGRGPRHLPAEAAAHHRDDVLEPGSSQSVAVRTLLSTFHADLILDAFERGHLARRSRLHLDQTLETQLSAQPDFLALAEFCRCRQTNFYPLSPPVSARYGCTGPGHYRQQGDPHGIGAGPRDAAEPAATRRPLRTQQKSPNKTRRDVAVFARAP